MANNQQYFLNFQREPGTNDIAQSQQLNQHIQSNQPPHQQQTPDTLYHLQQQTQQRQALGALAAASLSSILNPSAQSIVNQNRTLVPYDDLAQKAPESSNRQCCERWYKTEVALQQHKSKHITCEICGTFEATLNIVRDHKENIHGIVEPGRKIKKPDGVVPPNAPQLDTPEKIQAWIEARKKNWPSKANIERKEREDQERVARGELPRHSNKRKQQNTDNNRNNTNNKRNKMDQNSTPSPSITTSTSENKTTNKIQGLVNYASDSDEYHSAEDEPILDNSNSNKDDADNEDDADNDIMDLEADAISSKDPSLIGRISLPADPSQKPKPICKYFLRGKCKRGTQCRYLHEKTKKIQQQQNKSGKVESFRKRPHLLKMLLTKEIRQEHNILLQCFRYIKEQNFFDTIDDDKKN